MRNSQKLLICFGALVDDDNLITNVPFDYKKDFNGFLFKRK